jgi:ribose transport system substrate-binding protein
VRRFPSPTEEEQLSRRLHPAALVAACAALALGVAACGSSGTPSSGGASASSGGGKKAYTVYLSNSFLGNDWRQQMERTASAAATLAPLAGHVKLTVVNTDNDPTKQIQSLNQIILKKPDAILVDASSPDALDPTVQRACAQGIKVISFDQAVTADCAWKVNTDFNISAAIGARWLAETLHGKGTVLMDRGLAGNPVSLTMVQGFQKVLKAYPGIKIAGTYESQYALAPEEQAASSLIAAHPQIDGVLSQSYGTGVQKALQKAGRPPVAMYAQAYNGSFVQCATTKGIQCAITSNPATLGAEALKRAVDLLDGKQVPKTVILPSPAFETNDVSVPGTTFEKIVLGKSAFPDLPPGATLPFSPSWTTITSAQALGK